MKTTLLTPETDENAVKTAAALIRQGEVVGMPTETVYGLAASWKIHFPAGWWRWTARR